MGWGDTRNAGVLGVKGLGALYTNLESPLWQGLPAGMTVYHDTISGIDIIAPAVPGGPGAIGTPNPVTGNQTGNQTGGGSAAPTTTYSQPATASRTTPTYTADPTPISNVAPVDPNPIDNRPWLDQEMLEGIPNKYLAMGFGAIALLLVMKK